MGLRFELWAQRRGRRWASRRRPTSRRRRRRTRNRQWEGTVAWSRRAILERHRTGVNSPAVMILEPAVQVAGVGVARFNSGIGAQKECKEHDRSRENLEPLLFAFIFPTIGRRTATIRCRLTVSDLSRRKACLGLGPRASLRSDPGGQLWCYSILPHPAKSNENRPKPSGRPIRRI